MLEVTGAPLAAALVDAWRERVMRAAAALRWNRVRTAARAHLRGTTLALTAPVDQLFLATEVNEWAVCATLAAVEPQRHAALEAALIAAAQEAAAQAGEAQAAKGPPAPAPVLEETAALERFRRLAALQADPSLCALLDAAAQHGVHPVLDEVLLTLGSGAGGRSFPVDALPHAADIAWPELYDIPTALVTGSNGKTTTVRLLAACARAAARRTAYNSTDGVYLDAEALASGDYAGPVGARMVLREARAHTAVIEAARGGILRRGLAVTYAVAGIVTNVSSDHFGEYGIDDLPGLADVKLSIAAVVAPDGLLALNADDAQLRARVGGITQRFGRCPPLAWFALEAAHPVLHAHRLQGGSTCGVLDGHLMLHWGTLEHDLGAIAAMPLCVGGVASYNVANLAGAALGAAALGVPAATIAGVFARFGAAAEDNPGRLMRFVVAGANVVIDYAHNPDGLRGLLTVAAHLRGTGRLALLLGHAGNRRDADIQALARVAMEFTPDLVVIKENETQLRGRAPGEIPAILQAELRRMGFPVERCRIGGSEAEAAALALAWARRGDVLVLPIHSTAARTAVLKTIADAAGHAGAPPDVT